MKTINVEGLPEPVVRSLAAVAETVRDQLRNLERPRDRVRLSVKKGRVLGPLTREEIYKDAGRTGFGG